MIVALAGGVGAARFLRGLVRVVDPADVTVVVNTADDDRFHGLAVSPDLDTVTYTLAGAEHPEQGWGLADESSRVMDALDRYGEATWFRLGDRDLATHLFRTRRLEEGATLTEVTAEIATAWGVGPRLLPMSDDRVATRVTIRRPDGTTEVLSMQEWFVRERTAPPVVEVAFAGADTARPGPDVLASIDAADTILVCPSNPVISIGPILAVPGIRDAVAARRDHVAGVSPIVGGMPVRGMADRLMPAAGVEVSAAGAADCYRGLLSGWVIDEQDRGLASRIQDTVDRVSVMDTIMTDDASAETLARAALEIALP
jgi:LPPG:FO 2-phospho-L-lactate transferase